MVSSQITRVISAQSETSVPTSTYSMLFTVAESRSASSSPHLVSINRLEQIDVIMSTIIGAKFLELLIGAHSRWDVEVKGETQKPIIAEPDVVLKHVG